MKGNTDCWETEKTLSHVTWEQSVVWKVLHAEGPRWTYTYGVHWSVQKIKLFQEGANHMYCEEWRALESALLVCVLIYGIDFLYIDVKVDNYSINETIDSLVLIMNMCSFNTVELSH